jgi:hypothetical protein
MFQGKVQPPKAERAKGSSEAARQRGRTRQRILEKTRLG